jgi:hypothetical protein
MQSKDLLKAALEQGLFLIGAVLDDMKDAPFQFPTPNGGNHPMYVAGHLAYAEGQIVYKRCRGLENPVESWKDVFGGNVEPSADASKYPNYETVVAKLREMRTETIKWIDTVTEEQLDAPNPECPPQYAALFGTVRNCLLTTAMHTNTHFGQVTDCRRAAGRKPLMA